MRRALFAILLLLPALTGAKVLNVEFKFAPYTGDTKQDEVETVEGTVRVFVNGVFVAEQPVRKDKVPVMFDEREVAGPVWVPVESLGSVVRKGRNTIRIEFDPRNTKAPYKAQLRWASVTDQTAEESGPGAYKGTNQADEGVEEKPATGNLVMEREFTADFAKDHPWHHYPPVASLTDDDKQKLVALLAERAGWFKPDFAAIYEALGANERIKVDEVRQLKCLDAAYAAGLRVAAPPAGEVDFTLGKPEVVMRRKGGFLYVIDPKAFEKLKDDDVQMCAGMALSLVYPAKAVVVRTPAGVWEVVE